MKAEYGWTAVLGLATAYEFTCPEGQTLSEGVDRALEKHPLLTTLAIGVTAMHLCNLIPEKIDPFHQTLKYLK